MWNRFRPTPITQSLAAFCRSASSSTIAGHLPPSSINTGLRCLAATLPMMRPTAALPMNSILRIAGCAMIASVHCPASCRAHESEFKTPGGNSASLKQSASSVCVSGLSSDAFSTTVQPAPMAEQRARPARTSAPFHLHNISVYASQCDHVHIRRDDQDWPNGFLKIFIVSCLAQSGICPVRVAPCRRRQECLACRWEESLLCKVNRDLRSYIDLLSPLQA